MISRGEKSVAVGIPGDPRRYYYCEDEAESSAACIALAGVIRQIARWELPAGDGFTVKVVFVNEAGEPLTPPGPGPGDAAFAEMEAIADEEDG
jgi:hypothetical protein